MRRLITIALILGVAAMIGYALLRSGPRIPETSVLVLELGGRLEEAPAIDALQQLTARGPALPTLLLQLEKAAADLRIKAVLMRIRALDIGYARVQELRDAVSRVREAGKPVIALLDLASLNATRELYLASSADKIYLVPGFLGPFAGIAGQYLHLGGFFEKLGIQVEYERVGDYKSAPEMFAAREMSEPARQTFNELLDGLFTQIVGGIAAGRGLDAARVRQLVEAAPSTAAEYTAAGLADGVADQEEIFEREGLEDADELLWDTYLQVDPRDLGLRTGPQIALIFGDGPIVQGEHGRPPRRRTFAADTIAEALEQAGEEEDVRAIVLRINSGGGSALASDQLWRKLRKVSEKKPVVVSMADAAASGGYYVASGANAIIAEPASLTGSIGVFFLRPALSGLYRKLDIGSEVLARGRHAAIAAGDEPFTPEQRERTSHFVRALYQGFVERVSTGRGVSTEEVDRLGQGRIWLGEAALAHGLVDELGGLYAAVKRAKVEAELDADVDPERVIFPGPRKLIEQVRNLMQGGLAGWLMERTLPVELPEILRSAPFLVEGDLAYLPPYWIEIH
jgi:protease-4